MDFSLSPEHTELRARVRALVDDVLQPIEDEAERNHGRLSAETHARIHQAVLDSGLGANNIPKEFGGGGFNLTEQIVTHEQLGRLTNCLWVLVWSPSNVLVHGTPEQIERYLLPDVRGEHRHAYAITEGDAGSDPARDRGRGGLERRALRALRGQVVRDRRRRRLATSSSSRGPSTATSACPALFLVDKDSPGVEMTADPDYTHNFPYRHPEFTFTKTPVPRENILGERGRGFELTGEWFIEERVHIAARCVGACDRLIELGTDWALHREQFGGRIFDHQAVSFALADCAAEVTAARLLTYYVGWLADTGADRKLVHHKACDGEARRLRDRRPCRRSHRPDLRGPRLHAREPGRAVVARAARRPDLGGHVGDPAADHRARPRTARAGDAARDRVGNRRG